MYSFLHNCLAHPLLWLTRESKLAVRFHDWTASLAWPGGNPHSIEELAADLHAATKEKGVSAVIAIVPNETRYDIRRSVFDDHRSVMAAKLQDVSQDLTS